MKRTSTVLGGLCALVFCGLVWAAPAPAKACGSVKANGSYYTVGGTGVSCQYMRTWSRRMLQDGRKPRGWARCTIRSNSGGCERGTGRDRDFFIFYPPD